MKASFTARITCSVLAVTLAALPCNEALAAPTPTTSTPPATATPPATGTPPVTGTPPADTATPGSTDPGSGRDAEAPSAVTAPGETPTEVPGETPTEETPPAAEAPAEAEPPPPAVPEGPERPPEPTVANGKYKAKGNGLMIAGGALLGLGAAGLVTSVLLTRCDETNLDDSFGCKNRQNSTFAVPATAAATLLGAVLLLVGVGYRVRYKKWENWKPENAPKTAVYPTMLRGGAGVGYTVKF